MAIEASVSQASVEAIANNTYLVLLLRKIAYDEIYFGRAVRQLVRFAVSPNERHDRQEPLRVLESLFHLYLSGTHASLDVRLACIRSLMQSPAPPEQAIAGKLLAAALESFDFTSHYEFNFGSRSRDYGYQPSTGHEEVNWYAGCLDFAAQYALEDGSIGELVRTAIANEFRGLWTVVAQANALEPIARAIAAKRFWREGWLAVRKTRFFADANMPEEYRCRLSELEVLLRPKDLVGNIRSIVLGGWYDYNEHEHVDDLKADLSSGRELKTDTIQALGRDLAVDRQAFAEILPELLSGEGQLYPLGLGLAEASEDPVGHWSDICMALGESAQPNGLFAQGFLRGIQMRDAELANAFLNEVAVNAGIARLLPIMQLSIDIDDRGLARLLSSLEAGEAPIHYYTGWAYGRACDGLTGADFSRLVAAIAQKPEGMPVAIDILQMRLFSDRNLGKETAPEIIETGRQLLAAFDFEAKGLREQQIDFHLAQIALATLGGNEGKHVARRLCRVLIEKNTRYEVHGWQYNDLLTALVKLHPTDMLDELLDHGANLLRQNLNLIKMIERHQGALLRDIPDAIWLAWCEADRDRRYPIAAAAILSFKPAGEPGQSAWTELSLALLKESPDPLAVFRAIVGNLYPMSWSGSRAAILEGRLSLLERLDISQLPILASELENAKSVLTENIETERRWEDGHQREENERFE